MRLVFVMYAEDRDLLSSDPVYSNYYSVTGLFNRLREDAGRFPDTMDQRFGAWSQLITLFRLIYEGGQHGDFKIPPRKGYLFDPDRYPFLEGRQASKLPIVTTLQPTAIPRVSRWRRLSTSFSNLLILDGERLSYRTLDVEQIGSVYETVMGFNLEVAAGQVDRHQAGQVTRCSGDDQSGSPAGSQGQGPSEVAQGTERPERWARLLRSSSRTPSTIDELLAASTRRSPKKVTPRVVPAGAIVLQPSDERRRSGSHYTPRSLTEPIVRTTLEPILKQLCRSRRPTCRPFTSPAAKTRRRYTKGELADPHPPLGESSRSARSRPAKSARRIRRRSST